MQRSKKVKKATGKSMKWTNTGTKPRTLIIGGERTVIKPGAKFKAQESEVPQGFRDIFKCVTHEVAAKEDLGKVIVKFTLHQVGEEDAYEIVGSDEKVYTEEPLTKEEAEARVAELEAEQK